MDLKTAARARFDAVRPAIIDVSHRIHAHPELGFEEEHASTWLSAYPELGINAADALTVAQVASHATDRCESLFAEAYL